MVKPGPRALKMFEIGRPDFGWVQLAEGMGVPCTWILAAGFAKALRTFTHRGQASGARCQEFPATLSVFRLATRYGRTAYKPQDA
jgi:hypothetical protein